MGRLAALAYISPISRLYLAYISPISRVYLAYISPISRLYLAYISPAEVGRLAARDAREQRGRAGRRRRIEDLHPLLLGLTRLRVGLG